MVEPPAVEEAGANASDEPAANASDEPADAAGGSADAAGNRAEDAAEVLTDEATDLAEDAAEAAETAAEMDDAEGESRFGRPGKPLNRNGPFYIGFVGAIGALLAWNLLNVIAALSQVLTLVGLAAFLAVGLDPVVRWLQRRGVRRGVAVALVFLGVLAVFGGFVATIVPTVISQGSQLAQQLPDQIANLRRSHWIHDLDVHYHIVTNASDELRKKVSNGETLMQLFGGLLGASQAVISGFVSVVTVLVLTLYFLASLHTIAETGYRLVPASRRARARSLGDEMIGRIGGYVAGQVAVASINAILTFIMLTALDVPYSIVLSITVAILGVIPLVGATLGAVVVVLAGLFQSWQIGVGIAIYYLIYQQIENYVISPRIMARTVAVPGAVAMIAALAGAALMGVLGALIAIPIAAAILLILEEVVVPRQDRV